MSQDSPPRMKIERLFSAESLMRVGLATAHENDYFQRRGEESPMSLALTTTYENGIFGGEYPSLFRDSTFRKMTFLLILLRKTH
jgi:hypothetical protein